MTGVDLWRLNTSEHVAFTVAAGEHLVGVRIPGELIGPGPHPTVMLQAQPGRTYYFRISADRIDRMSEAEGLEFVKQTRNARESGRN